MTSLLTDYSSIKSGAYGSLMKSYVKKVGNQNALNAYRETGSTAVATESTSSNTSSKKTTSKSDFIDGLGKDKTTTSSKIESSTSSESTVTADKYAKYKSSWLDDQLKSYDKDANKTTAADTSVAMDTTI